MQFSALSALAAVLVAAHAETTAYNPNIHSTWSTLTPSAAAPTNALTQLTSSFGIAVSQITDSAELASISSVESAILNPTITLSSSSSESSEYSSESSEYSSESSYESSESSYEPSSSYSSDVAEPTESVDLSKYLTLVSLKSDSALSMTLEDGILIDSAGRIGSIVANRQFQFDGPPPQAGAIYAAGWSITENGTLAIGSSDVFFQCLSGTFYNLYDESIGDQCTAIRLQTVQFVDA